MHNPDEKHAAVTGEPAAPKGCTAGSGRGPLEKALHSRNLASGLPVLTHGRVPGRDFELRLALDAGGLLCIEVTDARTERRLPAPPPISPPADAEAGRGLLLVAALAESWGVTERQVGKKVWATLRTARAAGA